MTRLEHANLTVSNPQATAHWLGRVFGWRTRWEGPAMSGAGYTVHVGTDDSYLALYCPADLGEEQAPRYDVRGALNHLAVFTEDPIDAVEARVRDAGFTPINHGDYAPGRRFYFLDHDGIEWEVATHQS